MLTWLLMPASNPPAHTVEGFKYEQSIEEGRWVELFESDLLVENEALLTNLRFEGG